MSVITAHITVGKKSRNELISAINPIFCCKAGCGTGNKGLSRCERQSPVFSLKVEGKAGLTCSLIPPSHLHPSIPPPSLRAIPARRAGPPGRRGSAVPLPRPRQDFLPAGACPPASLSARKPRSPRNPKYLPGPPPELPAREAATATEADC